MDLANLGGLKLLSVGEPTQENWMLLPRVLVAMDLGSDGVCASGFAQRCLGLNLDVTPDISHLSHRGLDAALKLAGLRVFAMTAQLCFNTPHGPF